MLSTKKLCLELLKYFQKNFTPVNNVVEQQRNSLQFKALILVISIYF